MNASPRFLSKPIGTVLSWQLMATAALALLAWIFGGVHGAWSAVLGGAVSVCAGGVAAIVAARGKTQSAGGVLIAALLAEALKIGLVVILLWAVLMLYDEVVALAFFGSFFVTILLFSMAFFVREYK
ncbi:MAG: ATP synthase subunit I [Betaproteobacteria bacterium]|nr:ATP synthase subunit I [Betaproteobacteria bacterium]MSQ87811.1 ATP synthase subunit I [Betaproteobacteria bacterium]